MIKLKIAYINNTEQFREYDDTETFETIKEAKTWIKENIGKRPKSGLFQDIKGSKAYKQIGYVYSRYQNYVDAPGRYVQGVWIEFFDYDIKQHIFKVVKNG
jgi:hypothetical protein